MLIVGWKPVAFLWFGVVTAVPKSKSAAGRRKAKHYAHASSVSSDVYCYSTPAPTPPPIFSPSFSCVDVSATCGRWRLTSEARVMRLAGEELSQGKPAPTTLH